MIPWRYLTWEVGINYRYIEDWWTSHTLSLSRISSKLSRNLLNQTTFRTKRVIDTSCRANRKIGPRSCNRIRGKERISSMIGLESHDAGVPINEQCASRAEIQIRVQLGKIQSNIQGFAEISCLEKSGIVHKRRLRATVVGGAAVEVVQNTSSSPIACIT